VLSDAQKRQVYDTYGHAGFPRVGGRDLTTRLQISTTFSRFFGFEDLFGGGGRVTQPSSAWVRFGERHVALVRRSVRGCDHQIKLPRQEYCEACQPAPARKRARRSGLQTSPVAAVGLISRDFYICARVSMPGRGTNCEERAWSARQGRLEREKDH